MFDVTFANKGFLFLLLLIPALSVWYYFRQKYRESEVRFSSLIPFSEVSATRKERARHLPFILRMAALTFLIFALARPQSTSHGENVYSEGIDIILALDISGSMRAEDFHPNRIEAAKAVAQEFISGRTNDRIGLVIFASESFTQCPLTVDYGVLKNLLKPVKPGMIDEETAIGLGIANAVARLKDSKSKSKVIILLTDGVNNRGEIDPITAAQMAASYGIRIYTIGVGTNGEAPIPVPTQFGMRYQMIKSDLDENALTKIADLTDGKYFRATDNSTLERIYKEIDRLEKTRMEVRSYRHFTELFYPYVGFALLLLMVDIGISKTWLRKLP